MCVCICIYTYIYEKKTLHTLKLKSVNSEISGYSGVSSDMP